jgi:hypothetical protein
MFVDTTCSHCKKNHGRNIVKRRENLIAKEWQVELNQYIAGIIRAKNNKPIIVNGVSDHIHIFFWFASGGFNFIADKRHKKQLDKFYQQEKFYRKEIPMAGRIWRIYIFTLGHQPCLQLYFKSGSSPFQRNIQAGVHPTTR